MKSLVIVAAAVLIAAPALAQNSGSMGGPSPSAKGATTSDGSVTGNSGMSNHSGAMAANNGMMSSKTSKTSKTKKHHSTAMHGDMSGTSNGMSQSGNGQTGTQTNPTGH